MLESSPRVRPPLRSRRGRPPSRSIRCASLLALLLLAVRCQPFEPSELARARLALTRNEGTWARHGPDAYRMTQSLFCECLPAGTVVADVVDGSIVALRDPLTGEPETYATHAFHTVDGLFDVIRDAIDRRAIVLRVTYHRTLGYPTEIVVDYSTGVDDEVVRRVTGLTPLD